MTTSFILNLLNPLSLSSSHTLKQVKAETVSTLQNKIHFRLGVKILKAINTNDSRFVNGLQYTFFHAT